MSWNYANGNNIWTADDYTQLPALREDNIYQTLIGQDKSAMKACFYGVLEPPMTDDFFANAEKSEQDNAIVWEYVLDATPSGTKTSVVVSIGADSKAPVAMEVAIARNNQAIYLKRYEWAYWNEFVSKQAIDYIRANYPEIPSDSWDRCTAARMFSGLGGDLGMEEKLVDIAWNEVKPSNAESIARTLYENTLRDLMGRSTEISNGKVTVRLDEYNLKKMLAKAEQVKTQYGPNKVVTWVNPQDPAHKEYASYTGDKYYERVKKMVDVAHGIMDESLVPDLLSVLPLKKDGTFKRDQTIVLFDGKISDAATYDYYTTGDKMCLGITTGGDWWSENKGDVKVDGNTGRLAIVTLNTTRKLYPLLNEKLELQDIKTRTKYIKQADVKPGWVYEEKSGTKYLYFGIVDTGDPNWMPHYYARYTKKLEKLAKQATSLAELAYLVGKEDCSVSTRVNPRKFVAEIEEAQPTATITIEDFRRL